MSHYQKRPTQEQRILWFLRERGGAGAKVWELVAPKNVGGLGISQYNARIFGLREKGHDIRNVKPGHFVLIEKDQRELFK